MSTALLKTLIVILFFAVLASLSSALFFLFQDTGDDKKRALYALGTRITLAASLLLLITYGVMSGQLGLNAPWHGQ
ncbi:MAG: DUF2909 domain-containing protein [Pseudomonadales bacterium]|nr:DUF2909 domain-containing protein [Pseudomonadales bacterium]MEE2892416.1 DUF2909 domain-containing protein [Pseudomonadota bacterium]